MPFKVVIDIESMEKALRVFKEEALAHISRYDKERATLRKEAGAFTVALEADYDAEITESARLREAIVKLEDTVRIQRTSYGLLNDANNRKDGRIKKLVADIEEKAELIDGMREDKERILKGFGGDLDDKDKRIQELEDTAKAVGAIIQSKSNYIARLEYSQKVTDDDNAKLREDLTVHEHTQTGMMARIAELTGARGNALMGTWSTGTWAISINGSPWEILPCLDGGPKEPCPDCGGIASCPTCGTP